MEQKVDALKKKKEKETELFKVVEVDQKVTNDDTFEATYLNHQINSLLSWEEQVKRNLEQLKFEASQDKYPRHLGRPRLRSQNPVEQQAAQIHGGCAGRRYVHDARTVSLAGDQGRARR